MSSIQVTASGYWLESPPGQKIDVQLDNDRPGVEDHIHRHMMCMQSDSILHGVPFLPRDNLQNTSDHVSDAV
jgi:hypothetical protein